MLARSKRRRRLALASFAALLLAWLVGCTSTVTPPRDLRDSVDVLLIRDAMHRGLLLPAESGYVEFGFGDWSWYALGNDSWYHVFATVLWPTQGALSRREHAAHDPASARAAMPYAEFESFGVDRAAAEALRRRLQEAFDARRDERAYQAYLRMEFVPFDGSYWFASNCADACADWLVELGCEVSWVPIRIDLARDD
ncbi:MAG: hypothetical protein RL398_2385 [Planctomycetota bacterium]|jgi:hypothetical protein